MTIGSRTRPGSPLRTYVTTYPDGVTTELGTVMTGLRESKVWSGGDSSTTKRESIVLPFRLPNREVVGSLTDTSKEGPWIPRRAKSVKTVRVFEDRKRRRYRGDNPYSMEAFKTVSSPYVSTSYALDSSVYPPVGGMVTSVQERDSLTTIGDGAVFTQNWSSNDDIALLGKLREKIAGTSFNMGVFLGEGREALDMIARTATTLARSMRALKRGDIAGAARALHVKPPPSSRYTRRGVAENEVSSRWLELQYGWMPLISDVYEGAGYLATRLQAPFEQRYRARRQVIADFVPSGQNFEAYFAVGWTRKQVIARLTEVSETSLAGLQDPASVAWELAPHSFLADWFIPIGNYLHARALDSALTGTYTTTTVVKTVTSFSGVKPTDSPTPQYYPYSQVTTGVFGQTVRTSMSRIVEGSLDVPVPSFTRLSDVPSWKRAANAVALLTQAVIRGGSPARLNPH